MKTEPIKCGGCGGDTFKLFTRDVLAELRVECQQCNSVSVIKPKARISIEWTEGAEGVITAGWKE